MISFESDYITGCHPEVLKALNDTNYEVCSGYGLDIHTQKAKEYICEYFNHKVNPDDIIFLMGGTQVNDVVLDALCADYQGVITAQTGHIAVHEAGAIELSGHKVITIKGINGKMDIPSLKEYLHVFYQDENREHMVWPGVIYISYPTEYGTLYTKEELKELRNICDQNDLKLFIDGARLGYGLNSPMSSLNKDDIVDYSDAFYVGGTKVGALCGEAVVFSQHNMPPHFINFIKKRGALVAKGRIFGVQFETLFNSKDKGFLYDAIGQKASCLAQELTQILLKYHYELYLPTESNQVFVKMPTAQYHKFKEYVTAGFWETQGDDTILRFATTWSTTEQDLVALESVLKVIQ